MHLQASYLAERNATQEARDYTEAQFLQSVFSCNDVPYYDGYKGNEQCSRACLRELLGFRVHKEQH